MAKKVTKEQIIEAATGETWSWETVRNYLLKEPEYEEAIKAEKEAVLYNYRQFLEGRQPNKTVQFLSHCFPPIHI